VLGEGDEPALVSTLYVNHEPQSAVQYLMRETAIHQRCECSQDSNPNIDGVKSENPVAVQGSISGPSRYSVCRIKISVLYIYT